jgi:hypothetical protein
VACVSAKGCRVGHGVGGGEGDEGDGGSGGSSARGSVGGDCVREAFFPTKY